MPASRCVDLGEVDVIAPNFKRRLSGVTSTIIQLVPKQIETGLRIAVLGPGLPSHLPHVRFRDLWKLWRRPRRGGRRVWHARRNSEMLPGLILRDLLRMKLRVMFTSAAQRHHTKWTRFLIARMDAVVATSGKSAAYLRVPNTVVMHGVDLARFRPPEDKAAAKLSLGLDPARKYAGCFGRVRHQKGTDLFVDTMIALLPEFPEWSAIITGRVTAANARFDEELKQRVARAGLGNRILFLGEHPDIVSCYQALDLFVAPQRWEGFGLTPLEAMASAVPVVAADVGAFSELVVEGETGCVVPADDLDALARATRRFIEDDALRQRAGQSALRHVQAGFPLDLEAARLAEIYRTLGGAAPLEHDASAPRARQAGI